MTLGEQIQALRKEAGISQEELGEKLGVSRQSVSKWESDLTTPELDKLIAMSKLFGVSIGTLLGIEEGAEEPKELTDRELAALERIAQKLEKPAPEPQKRKRWPYVLAAAVIVVAGCYLFGRIQRLESQMSTLYSGINSLNGSVSSQLNSLTGQITDILEAQDRVTAAQGYLVEKADLEGETVTFRLWATPREYREGMTAEFSAAGAFSTVTVQGDQEGQSYSATLTCPLADDVTTLSVSFRAGDVTWNQTLGEEGDLRSSTFPDVYCTLDWMAEEIIDGTWDMEHDQLFLSWDAGLTNALGTGQGAAALTGMDLRLWQDGTVVWEDTVTPEADNDSVWLSYTLHLTGLQEGDQLILSALCSDSYGRTWEQWLDGGVVTGQGEGQNLKLTPAGPPEVLPWETE
jgi:transcriptional regulator with XRE-family HTH domain